MKTLMVIHNLSPDGYTFLTSCSRVSERWRSTVAAPATCLSSTTAAFVSLSLKSCEVSAAEGKPERSGLFQPPLLAHMQPPGAESVEALWWPRQHNHQRGNEGLTSGEGRGLLFAHQLFTEVCIYKERKVCFPLKQQHTQTTRDKQLCLNMSSAWEHQTSQVPEQFLQTRQNSSLFISAVQSITLTLSKSCGMSKITQSFWKMWLHHTGGTLSCTLTHARRYDIT